MRTYKYKTKRKGYNSGGRIDDRDVASSIAQGIGMINPAAGAIAGIAASFITPSDYSPVRQNTSPGFNIGGPITPNNLGANRTGTLQDTGNFIAGQFNPLAVSPEQVGESNLVARQRAGALEYNKQLNTSGLQGSQKPWSHRVVGLVDQAEGNATAMNYNKGGMIDTPLNSGGAQINGNPGIDNNSRVVNGAPVNLTEGETVQDLDIGTFVFSDSKDMLDPETGKTFAKGAKPHQKSLGDAEKALRKNPNDQEAKRVIALANSSLETIAKRQQLINGNHGEKDNFNLGGYPGNPYLSAPAIAGFTNNMIGNAYQERSRVAEPLWKSNITPVPNKLPLTQLDSQRSAVPSTTNTAVPASAGDSSFKQTRGDRGYLPVKVLETLGRGIQAFQPTEQTRLDAYNVNKPKFNPNQALRANNSNFRSATYNTNTGSSNADRAYKASLYANKLKADNRVISEYDQLQQRSDLNVDQNNRSQERQVATDNAQSRAAAQREKSNFLTSVGNLASGYQNYNNAQVANNLDIATLNSLSSRYGVSTEELLAIMNGDTTKKTTKFKTK